MIIDFKIFETFERFSIFMDILNYVGIDCDYFQLISNGSNGFACDIGYNRVLKITTHKEEAYTSSWLIGADFKHIVNIYDVFTVTCNKRFPERLPIRFPYWDHVWFIIEEKLETQPVQGEVADFLIDFMNRFNPSNYKKLGIFHYLKQDRIKKYYNGNIVNPKFRQTYKEVYELLQHLSYYDLNYLDFQSGNVGRNKKGEMKILDVYFNRKKGNIKHYNVIL